MKKRFMVIALAITMVMASASNRVFAAHHNLADTGAAATPGQRLQQIKTRLDEIYAMDISTLSAAEKKDLRREVKTMRGELKQYKEYKEAKEARHWHGGIFISFGALIVVILLLIIIF